MIDFFRMTEVPHGVERLDQLALVGIVVPQVVIAQIEPLQEPAHPLAGHGRPLLANHVRFPALDLQKNRMRRVVVVETNPQLEAVLDASIRLIVQRQVTGVQIETLHRIAKLLPRTRVLIRLQIGQQVVPHEAHSRLVDDVFHLKTTGLQTRHDGTSLPCAQWEEIRTYSNRTPTDRQFLADSPGPARHSPALRPRSNRPDRPRPDWSGQTAYEPLFTHNTQSALN